MTSILIFTAVMGQVLRIHFNATDHAFKIINEEPINGETQTIKVQINGDDLTLIRKGQSWIPIEPANDDVKGLAEAIGKAIALRYRI